MTISLVRQPLDLKEHQWKLDQYNRLDEEAKSAKSTLSCSPLCERTEQLRTEQENRLASLQVLRELNLEPFIESGVRSHKWRIGWQAASIAAKTAVIGIILAAVMIFWGFLTLLFLPDISGYLLICGFFGFMGSAMLFVSLAPFCWKEVSFEKCDFLVPERVIGSARAIKEKCPEANILIDTLYGRNPKQNGLLLVRFPTEEEYYLDAWDEDGIIPSTPSPEKPESA